MEEQFIDYDLSLKLKKLGFDEECLGYYRDGKLETIWISPYNKARFEHIFSKQRHAEANADKRHSWQKEACLAPLYQQARNFLLEKYGKFPVLYSDGFKWTYDLRWPDPGPILKDPYPFVMFPEFGEEDKREYFDTYQQAELRAIEKIIEIEENNGTINRI